VLTVNTVVTTQTPYGGTAVSLPGTIQAENFDEGGEGVAYHDMEASNQGGQYRTNQGVDIEGSVGAYNVGWAKAGEWLEYTVNVQTAGTYNIEARVAAGFNSQFHIEIDGIDKTGLMTIPDTGGWQTYQILTKSNISLNAGLQIIRIAMDTIGSQGWTGNFDYIRVVAPPPPEPASITSQPSSQTVTVGQTVTFSVTATGTTPLTYQWKKGTVNVGTNSATFSFSNAQIGDAGSYSVTVSNGIGSPAISNTVTLTVNSAPPAGSARGRVRVQNNTVVADNGSLLRGEHILMTTWNSGRIGSLDWYKKMSRDYRLNTVRLLVYQNPVEVGLFGNPPSQTYCQFYGQCNLPFSTILPMLDTAVANAKAAGLYAIIDYHPLGGYRENDALAWWSVVAPRYKDEPHVIYEVTNEPTGTGGTHPPLPAYQQALYALIRPLAPNTHLIMWSVPDLHAGNRAQMVNTNIDYSNATAGFHIYGTDWSQVAPLRAARPIYMTEAQVCQGTPTQCQNSQDSYISEAMNYERGGYSWILLKSIPVADGHPDLLDKWRINHGGAVLPWPLDPYFVTNPQ
jgi:hypothetical protein